MQERQRGSRQKMRQKKGRNFSRMCARNATRNQAKMMQERQEESRQERQEESRQESMQEKQHKQGKTNAKKAAINQTTKKARKTMNSARMYKKQQGNTQESIKQLLNR